MKIKITKLENEPLNRAYRYYSILSAIGDLGLTEREIQLLAYISIVKNISYSKNKEEFCNKYNSSFATINNMISKLKRKKLIIKDEKRIKINPELLTDFNQSLILRIDIN